MNIFKVCYLFSWSISSLQISAMKVDQQHQSVSDNNYSTLLHSAASNGHLESLKELLNKNIASIQSKDDLGRNALFYATLSEQAECVEAIFLAACSEMEIANFEELRNVNKKSAELLEEIITAEDTYQQSAYFCSQVSKNEKIKKLFQKAENLLIQANIWDKNHNYCSIF